MVVSPQPSDASKRRVGAALAVLVGALLLCCGTVLLLSLDAPLTRRHDPQTRNAYVGGDVTMMAAKVQGYLVRLLVGDNQFVHAGDLVAEIATDEYQAALQRAQAELQATQAQRDGLIAQRQELVAQIGQTRSTEAGSAASAQRTLPELTRQQALVRTDAGLRRALDQAVADQRSTDARIAASKAQVRVRERQADILDAALRGAEAAIAAREADVVLARLDLGWTRIVAPIDGWLGARQVREGDLLRPGSTIVSITPLEGVWVDANFTENQTSGIRIGDAAVLRLDTFSDDPLDGRVVGLSPVTGGRLGALPPDNTTGNFTKVPARVPVRIAIDWGNGRLHGLVRPGMSALATVTTGRDRCGSC